MKSKYKFGTQNSLWWFGFYALLHIAAAYVAGLPDDVDDLQPALFSAAVASLGAAGTFTLLQAVIPNLLPRFVITAGAAIIPVWTMSCGLLSAHSERRQRKRDRVFAILSPDDAAALRSEAEHSFPYPEETFSLVGVVDPVTLNPAVLRTQLETTATSLVVLSEEAQRDENLVEVVADFHSRGVRVRTLTGFYDGWLGKLPLAELGPMALMFDINEVHHNRYTQLKRIIDLVLGFVGLLITIALVPFVWAFNLVANRGPLFYRQERIGRNDKTFTIVKFRTMRPELLQPDTPWTSVEDPRITPFGRVLRKAHLDEFPQMWNVLRGDISLVGPRPEQPHYVRELRSKNPFYGFRHAVQPGITGWAQVKYRYAATEADAFEKLQYDLYYLRHQSLTLDLRILSRTVRSIVWSRGH